MKTGKKAYLRIQIHTTSSLSIGSGNNDTTDSDIIRDGCGVPFIPGTAIAGVTRHALAYKGKEFISHYFGPLNTEKLEESRLSFYDVFPVDTENLSISVRDQVALDKYKTGIKGAKFDMETLEPGVDFVVIMEQDIGNGDSDVLDQIACVWKDGRVTFGAKTTRGYGEFTVSDVRKAVFDLTDRESVKSWLGFDMFSPDGWSEWSRPSDINVPSDEVTLTLGLRQAEGSGLSIRKYTTVPSDNKESAPDFSQMSIHGGYPVIPGTSWAGAFRHHILELAEAVEADPDEIKKGYFGYADKDSKRKSDIFFSESILKGAEWKILSRNAIDRFTGGAAYKALYTEKTCYGGSTQLVIRWKKRGQKDDSRFATFLAASVVDLSEGILSIGGETSIGRGVFKVTDINGKSVGGDSAEKIYENVRSILMGGDL